MPARGDLRSGHSIVCIVFIHRYILTRAHTCAQAGGRTRAHTRMIPRIKPRTRTHARGRGVRNFARSSQIAKRHGDEFSASCCAAGVCAAFRAASPDLDTPKFRSVSRSGRSVGLGLGGKRGASRVNRVGRVPSMFDSCRICGDSSAPLDEDSYCAECLKSDDTPCRDGFVFWRNGDSVHAFGFQK